MSHQWFLQEQDLFDTIRFMWITNQPRVSRLMG